MTAVSVLSVSRRTGGTGNGRSPLQAVPSETVKDGIHRAVHLLILFAFRIIFLKKRKLCAGVLCHVVQRDTDQTKRRVTVPQLPQKLLCYGVNLN